MERVLVFEVGGERYGLRVEQVQEILETPDLHFIPLAPEIFPGAINFHGHILPVLDLPVFLGCPRKESFARVVVLSLELGALALGVDSAGKILRVEDDAIPASEEEKNPFVCAWLEDGDGHVRIMDAARLLADFDTI